MRPTYRYLLTTFHLFTVFWEHDTRLDSLETDLSRKLQNTYVSNKKEKIIVNVTLVEHENVVAWQDNSCSLSHFHGQVVKEEGKPPTPQHSPGY